jgi:hypothetical protein
MGYVGAHQRFVQSEDGPFGDTRTFVAIDAETNVVPCFRVGKRNAATAHACINDLANRMTNRV